MASGEIRAGRAYYELFVKGNVGAELDKVAAKLKDMGSTISGIGARMAAMGAAILAPLGLAATQFASMGDEVNKASQRIGISVRELSALKYAAEQSGASLEDIEGGLRKMQKALFEAAGGSKSAQEAFASIGLTVRDLQGLSPDEQFSAVADRLADVTDAGTRASVAMEIFGKGGAGLLPLILEGADGIKELTDRAHELGVTFSQEDAEAATLFGDTLDDVTKQLKAVVFNVGSAVANALQPFAEGVIEALTSVIGWVKENKNLVVGVLAVGAALVTGGVALVGFGVAMQVVGTAITGFKTALAGVTAVFGLLTNPIVLIGAGLVALAGYFLATSEAGGEALDWLGNKFNTLSGLVTEAIGGMADALAAGDIGLAAKILWAGLQATFAEGSQEVQAGWIKFKALFVQTAAAAFYGTLEIWENVKARLETAWENTTAFLGDLWDGFTGTFVDAWNTAVNTVAKGLTYIRSLWDDSFDPAAAAKAADEMLAQGKAARAAEEAAKLAAREDNRKQSIADIEAERTKLVKELNEREQAINAGAGENARADLAELTARKASLEEQLKNLRQEARTAKQTKEDDATGGPPRLDKSGRNWEDILKNRAQVQPVEVKAAGTFNANAVQFLGGGQVADRIAKATEETSKNTAKIAKQKATFK